MQDINDIINKYDKSIVNKLNIENFSRIVLFLRKSGCDFVDDIVENYLDLFVFDYDEFVNKYYKLDVKYNGNFLKKASYNMDILEEFYTI